MLNLHFKLRLVYENIMLSIFKTSFSAGGSVMDIDFRVVAVLAPIALAAGWAGFNIFQAALGQIQSMFSEE